jgi:hypothetical protein
MGTWQIGESGPALALDPQGRGEVAFTVTNASAAADRAVLKVNPLDGAAVGWFTVTEPVRSVAAGGSVVFPVGVAVPSSVAAGTFALQGVAYSADTDPSETSVTSKRVSLAVGDTAAPPRTGLPWWVFAVGGAAVLLVGVVFAVLLLGGDDDGEASAATEPTDAPTEAGDGSAGDGSAGGGIIRTIPRDLIVPAAPASPAAPAPELIKVSDVVGIPASDAIEILDGDFEVVVEVDCSKTRVPPTDSFVLDQEPRSGNRPEGSEVTLVRAPVEGTSECL